MADPSPLGIAAEGAGTLLNVLFQWYAMDQQADENRRTREANKAMFETQLGFEKETFGKTLALGKRKQAFTEQQGRFAQGLATDKFASGEESKQFNRQMGFMNGFTSMINSSPQMRGQLVNLWRQ